MVFRSQDVEDGQPAGLPDTSRGSADPGFATTLANGLGILEAFRNSTGPLSNSGQANTTRSNQMNSTPR